MSRPLNRGRAACAAAATILSTLILTAVPATAALAASATGHLTLYADTAFSQPTNSVSYPTCASFIGTVPGQRVGSFDNSPLSGCQVVLHALTGDHILCAGRAVVPPAFRRVILYSIRTGSSAPCAV
jgi:hypothetical protein